jgi:hypothetical protein
MHICFHKKWFYDYENIIPLKVYMGNNLIQEAIGKSNVDITMEIIESFIRNFH